MTDSKTQLGELEAERLQQSIDRIEQVQTGLDRLFDQLPSTKGEKRDTRERLLLDLIEAAKYVGTYLATLRGGPRPERETTDEAESIPFRRTR